MDVEAKLKTIPSRPGVYMMRGGKSILYIGKAKDLKARVRSYFRKTGDTRYAARFLSSRTDDIDFIVTTNEKEALILEDTLLKKHKPKYNIRLKDDKTYVSIKLTINEDFPRLSVTRLVRNDGGAYFGPYASSTSVRDTIKLLRKVFPLCVCSAHEFRNRVRPCLDYQLGLCASPATGHITKEAYAELVRGAIMFLEGRSNELVRMLRHKMHAASDEKKFEEAAVLRDKIRAIESMLEEQKVVSAGEENEDYMGLCREEGFVAIDVLSVRGGRLVGKRSFVFKDAGLDEKEALSSFLARFYSRLSGNNIPEDVFMQEKLDDEDTLSEWLTDRRGSRVAVTCPERGRKRKLLTMAISNARESLQRKNAEVKEGPLTELRQRLRLSKKPRVIEAFDISNIQGQHAVGAMVTFVDCKPEKSRYRLFKIKSIDGPDDYAMMREVLVRRYSNAELTLPDLAVIDGGKGQLAVALDVARELKLDSALFVALAKDKSGETGGKEKKGERVFLPGVKDPVKISRGTKGDLLLRRIRDEVHRFAISYHRKLRKASVGSVFEKIPGMGRSKTKALFERFGDMEGVRNASIDELAEVKGITQKLALAIKEALG